MSTQYNRRTEGWLTDVIKFLQGPLLSLGDPEEDEDERGDVESAIEPPSDKF